MQCILHAGEQSLLIIGEKGIKCVQAWLHVHILRRTYDTIPHAECTKVCNGMQDTYSTFGSPLR
jgi:hypothetical protein